MYSIRDVWLCETYTAPIRIDGVKEDPKVLLWQWVNMEIMVSSCLWSKQVADVRILGAIKGERKKRKSYCNGKNRLNKLIWKDAELRNSEIV